MERQRKVIKTLIRGGTITLLGLWVGLGLINDVRQYRALIRARIQQHAVCIQTALGWYAEAYPERGFPAADTLRDYRSLRNFVNAAGCELPDTEGAAYFTFQHYAPHRSPYPGGTQDYALVISSRPSLLRRQVDLSPMTISRYRITGAHDQDLPTLPRPACPMVTSNEPSPDQIIPPCVPTAQLREYYRKYVTSAATPCNPWRTLDTLERVMNFDQFLLYFKHRTSTVSQ
jgi:hypothetical protein